MPCEILPSLDYSYSEERQGQAATRHSVDSKLETSSLCDHHTSLRLVHSKKLISSKQWWFLWFPQKQSLTEEGMGGAKLLLSVPLFKIQTSHLKLTKICDSRVHVYQVTWTSLLAQGWGYFVSFRPQKIRTPVNWLNTILEEVPHLGMQHDVLDFRPHPSFLAIVTKYLPSQHPSSFQLSRDEAVWPLADFGVYMPLQSQPL